MLMEIGLPKMRGLLVMTMDSISPSGREVSPAESLRRRAKVLLPKFRLETAALRPESLPIFFQVKMTYIPKDRHRRWAEEATTPQGAPQGGLARPGGLCPPGGPPLVFIGSNISYIIHKKSPSCFSLFGVVQNRWSDVAFPGLDFQLPEFSLVVCTLQIMGEKALELLQKTLLWIKTS